MRAVQLTGVLAAVVGPLAVLGLALWGASPAPVLGEKAITFERLVRRQPADVVVVGASFADTDIDPVVLGEGLGESGKPALVLGAGDSAAPYWYAVLKERVYGNGLEPRVIVLPVSLATAMVTRLTPEQVARVTEQMPVPDAVITRKTLDSPLPPAVQALLRHRGALRDPILDAFRDVLPRWFLGVDHAGVAAAGTAVFGEQHAMAGQRALPTVEVEAEGELGAAGGWTVDDPAESYLADIVDLADAHGARVVVVLPPTMDQRAPGQQLAPEVEAAVGRWAAARGVTWVDLRSIVWDVSRYKDDRHMRKDAARAFTALVVERVQAGGDGAGGAYPTLAGVARTGTPPALPTPKPSPGRAPCEVSLQVPDLGFFKQKALPAGVVSPLRVWEGARSIDPIWRKGSCTGTMVQPGRLVVSRFDAGGPPLRLAWEEEVPDGVGGEGTTWVLPGTTVTWTLAAPWTPGGDATVAVRAGSVGPGTGVATLGAGETAESLTVDGGWATARVAVPAEGVSRITLTSPADGPFLFVDTVTLETERGEVALVGEAGPRKLELFRPGMWTAPGPAPEFPATPPRTASGTSWFEIPWEAQAKCSPLRVEHEGALLPVQRPGQNEPKPGARQRGRRLTFDPVPGTDPAVGYRVVYDPDRTCPRACKGCPAQVWLYPGDELVVSVPARKRAAFGVPIVALQLNASLDGAAPPGAGIHVVVTLGDEVVGEGDLTGDGLGPLVRVPLTRAVAPEEPGDIRVALTGTPDLPAALLLGGLVDR